MKSTDRQPAPSPPEPPPAFAAGEWVHFPGEPGMVGTVTRAGKYGVGVRWDGDEEVTAVPASNLVRLTAPPTAPASGRSAYAGYERELRGHSAAAPDGEGERRKVSRADLDELVKLYDPKNLASVVGELQAALAAERAAREAAEKRTREVEMVADLNEEHLDAAKRHIESLRAKLAAAERERDELKDRRRAESDGEDAAEAKKPDAANPHPVGSSPYVAWQNGYWAARSHAERIAALRLLGRLNEDEDTSLPDAVRGALAAAEQREARLREVLRAVEWRGRVTYGDGLRGLASHCPCCDAARPSHRPGCALADALADDPAGDSVVKQCLTTADDPAGTTAPEGTGTAEGETHE